FYNPILKTKFSLEPSYISSRNDHIHKKKGIAWPPHTTRTDQRYCTNETQNRVHLSNKHCTIGEGKMKRFHEAAGGDAGQYVHNRNRLNSASLSGTTGPACPERRTTDNPFIHDTKGIRQERMARVTSTWR
ncbi:unnamed protein product, partial [Ixodes pacificus]